MLENRLLLLWLKLQNSYMVYKNRGWISEVCRGRVRFEQGSISVSLFRLALSSFMVHVLTTFLYWLLSVRWLQQLQVLHWYTMLSRTRDGSSFTSAIKWSPTHSLMRPITLAKRTILHLWHFVPNSRAGTWANHTKLWLSLNCKRVKGCGEALGFKILPSHNPREKRNSHSRWIPLTPLGIWSYLTCLALGVTGVWKITIGKSCVTCLLIRPNIRKCPVIGTFFISHGLRSIVRMEKVQVMSKNDKSSLYFIFSFLPLVS